MPDVSPPPFWLPTASTGARTLPAGRWWDAVQVDAATALFALGQPTGPCGPVVEDTAQQLAWWLAPVGSAAGWGLPGVCVLGEGHHLTVPPAEWRWVLWAGGPPLRWLTPPRGEQLTDPRRLRTALAYAVAGCSTSTVSRG